MLIVSLTNKIQELEQMIQHAGIWDAAISEKNVAWHVDHSLKVIIKSCEALKKSEPFNFQLENNPARTRVFKSGTFQRGVAKAPKAVTATGEIKIVELQIQLMEARKQIDEIKDLHEDCHYFHPYFGALNLSLAIQFFGIHTNHHLKIIHDIINKHD